MIEQQLNRIFGSLVVAAGLALAVFAGMIVFTPERLARPIPTPPAEALNLDLIEPEESPSPEPDEDATPAPRSATNRNERARALGRWNR